MTQSIEGETPDRKRLWRMILDYADCALLSDDRDELREDIVTALDSLYAALARNKELEQLIRDMGVELARTDALARKVPALVELAKRFSVPQFEIDAAIGAPKE